MVALFALQHIVHVISLRYDVNAVVYILVLFISLNEGVVGNQVGEVSRVYTRCVSHLIVM